jgi:hypothetical protein
VIGSFCDFAMNLRGDFERYASAVIAVLQMAQAQDAASAGDDEDLLDYINELHISIVEAYTGIVSVQFPELIFYFYFNNI